LGPTIFITDFNLKTTIQYLFEDQRTRLRWFLKQEIPIDIQILQIEIVASVETDGRPSLHHSQFRLYIIRHIIADSYSKNNNPLLQPASKHKLVKKHSNRWIKYLFLCFLLISFGNIEVIANNINNQSLKKLIFAFYV